MQSCILVNLIKKNTMKFTTIVSIGIISCIQFTHTVTAQHSLPFKAKRQFEMPANITQNDYLSKTIVFKLKDQFRNIASKTEVNHALLKMVLDAVGVNTFGKKFPLHQSPETKFNTLGQAFADLSLIYELKYNNNFPIENVINQLLATGIMEFAEPHYAYKIDAFTPNDPSFSSQSSFFARIRATEAWDLTLGGSQGTSSVVIGIVDSGTDIDHPDLVSQFKLNTADPINGADDDLDGYIDNYKGYDLAGADYNNIVGDNDADIKGNNNNHGSHVSGCAAAATNNGVGVSGIGFNCKLLPVKCAADNDTRGSGGAGYIIAGYEGITYAADHGAKIINCSWGGTSGGSYGQTIVDYATINKNCLVVASAGNSNLNEKNYPASFNYVFSVAATNSTTDTKATFSTYHYDVDISTPGNNIYETLYNNSYGSMSGTSMSSPITAGGAGLVQSKFNYTNALQIGQRLKQTSDNHYTTGPNITGTGNPALILKDRLGKGRMNLQRALTDPAAPSVVFSNEVVVDHNDNALIAGDSLFITGDFLNYLSPTSNLTASVTIVSGAANLTVIDNTTSLGVINMLSMVQNTIDPFKFKINAGTPQNTNITFKVTLTDGTYSDVYYFVVTVNVDYINIAINDVATTITSKGKLGYNLDAQSQGLGFSYLGNNLMYEAGLMIGTSTSVVSDAFRGSNSAAADADFQSVVMVSRAIPSTFSEFDAHGRFNDAPGAPTQNLLVSHSAYAWSTPGNRKYVIVEYVIKNNGTVPLSNLYAGISSDWDIDATTASQNKANYVSAKNLGYVYSTAAGGKFAGIKVLTNTAATKCYHIDNVAGGGGGIDVTDTSNYFSTAEKYTSLSTNRLIAGVTGTTTTGTDIIEVVSTGPYFINAGDSATVAFALIAGDDLVDITKSADSAQVHYNGNGTVTGILSQTTAKGSVIVYPNPTSNNLNFMINTSKPAKVEITVVNTLGQTILQEVHENVTNGNNIIKTNVEQLPIGTYFYRVKVDEDLTTGKIMITK